MGMAGGVLSGIGDVAGTVLGMDARKNASMSREAQYRDNQSWAKAQAADALRRGAIAAGWARERGALLAGQQAANLGASGVVGNEGTAAEVQASSKAMSELDAMTIQNNAAREALGYERNARAFGRQAGIEHDNGNDEQTATFLGGMGRLAGDLGGMAGGGGQ